MIEIRIDPEHAILIPEATDREVAMLSPVLSAMREAKRDSEILLALDAGDGDACGEVSESGYICTRRAEPHDLHVAHGTDENEHTYVCETWRAV